MATCSYSKLVGGACGPSVSNPANVECVLIGECGKDIQGHLKLIPANSHALGVSLTPAG